MFTTSAVVSAGIGKFTTNHNPTLNVGFAKQPHRGFRLSKKAHCRGEHCSPVPVRPVRSFPKRALLRKVGGRTMFAPTFSIKQSRCFLTYCSPIGLQYQPRLKAHNERRQPHVASLFYLLILPSVGISGESSSSKSATFLNGSSYSLKLN